MSRTFSGEVKHENVAEKQYTYLGLATASHVMGLHYRVVTQQNVSLLVMIAHGTRRLTTTN